MKNFAKNTPSFFYLILMVLMLVNPIPKVVAQSQDVDLPNLSQLNDGWNTLYPGGETTCALGEEYQFWARVADPKRLAVYLYGGGGCWDAETCDPERENHIYASTIEPDEQHPKLQNGIFKLDHPENPLEGYSMIAIPVCTGDAYLGDRDVPYTLETESGETRTFRIHHRGQKNTMAVMDWIFDNFDSPREIFVAGSSAGSIGMPFYASLLAQHYPTSRVVGLGDDTGSFGSKVMSGAEPGQWGIPKVLQHNEGWQGFDDDTGVEPLYIHAAKSAPNLRLYQFDHAHDAVQKFYMELVETEDQNVLQHIRANRKTIGEKVPEFRSFTVGGFEHTVLRSKRFYHYQTDDHRLSDWVASVDCADDCLRPGLVYGEEDLKIIERAIELLSVPGTWNPKDESGTCPNEADSYSLRYATVQAIRVVTGQSPGGKRNLPPAVWDIIYTVTDRLEHKGRGDVVRWYNNHEDTKAADVIAVLEEVKDRIRNKKS